MAFTILIIDDDQVVREMASELLAAEGRGVLAAPNGEEGLAMALTIRPDLILVDSMNGLEVVQRLKASVATMRVPVVALTSGTAEDASELSRAGCLAFIPKQFEPREFLRLIADVLNERVGRGRRGGDPSPGG
jgi:CheY-like chemotaxis protein